MMPASLSRISCLVSLTLAFALASALVGAGAAQTTDSKQGGPKQNTTPPPPKTPPKTPPPPKKPDPAAADKQQVAGTLRTSYALLAAGNSGYGNHINIAMGEVQAALTVVGAPDIAAAKKAAGALKGHTATFAKTLPINGINMDQAVCDALIYRAGQMLNGLESVLEAQNKFPKAQPHIKKAIVEITLALQISAVVAIKGKEADILTGAYVLLAVANDTYAGHQNKAKAHVKNAIDTLDASVLARGSVAQKITAMRDALVQGKADGSGQVAGPIRMTQPTSDACVQLAGALVMRVGPFTNRPVADELSKAVMEIGTALAIR